jgi:hypothetical protein
MYSATVWSVLVAGPLVLFTVVVVVLLWSARRSRVDVCVCCVAGVHAAAPGRPDADRGPASGH